MWKIYRFILVSLGIALCSCNQPSKTNGISLADTKNDQIQIAAMLDSFNIAAAKADFNKYFSYYAGDAIFTGTDATERWDKKQFMDWAKPIFDKGTAWDFKTMERHIYFDKTATVAWFDELLNTQMKICRGSGVLIKEGNEWKIKQYILSAMIPNEQIDSVTKNKTAVEDRIINNLLRK